MVVGEAPGFHEEQQGIPFVGSAGLLLDDMLREAGLRRQDCFITNVCKYRPPNNDLHHFFIAEAVGKAGNKPVVNGLFPNELLLESLTELYKEILDVKPNIIILFGNWPLWALTECAKLTSDKKHKGFKLPTGIGKWRGSLLPTVVFHDGVLSTAVGRQNYKCLPTYHPAAILRVWEWRSITVHDLRRVKCEYESPEYRTRSLKLLVRPSFKDAMDWINNVKSNLIAVDIETRLKHIACLGIADSLDNAICIPFMCTERYQGYWTAEEELALVKAIKGLVQSKKVIGQNFIYDMQYIARRWGFVFPIHADTMLTQHVIFPGTPKDLAYISSLYSSDYCYWKDEGKEWNPSMDEDQLWTYNCKDAIYTFEDHIEQQKVIAAYKLQEQNEFLHSLFEPILHMMLRGTQIDMSLRTKMGMELLEAMQEREAWFHRITGGIKIAKSKNAKPWYRSAQQLKTLLYDWMHLPVQKQRKTKEATTDNEALEKLMVVEPLIKPLLRRLQEYRSLGVFYNTFISAGLEWDNRIRCSYNIGGTETYRFSSSEDAFGYGTNLQNIPKGSEE